MVIRKADVKEYEKPVLHAQKIEFERPSGVTCAAWGFRFGDPGCIGNQGNHNPGDAGSPALS
ncbi:MAG: hypothetical protein IBX64_04105 [Actinobacteria bacterium]|nr:hypothetical protein [Actinomycetota bacterium]